MLRLGIDLGGTKMEIAAIDPAGNVRLRRREPAPAGTYQEGLEAIARLVRQAEHELGEAGQLGIGLPGVVDGATGVLRHAHATIFNAKPLGPDLEALLGRPVRFANDANCFALSEAHDGAGAGEDVVFGAILGTGAGAGLVVGGRLLTGPNGIAGEWGHNSLPWPRDEERPGPVCYCGQRGCIERFVCGPALSDDYERTTGARLAAAEIAALARSGDAACEQALGRLEDRLARALASVINLVDPDVIVFGGGLSNVDRIPANAMRLAAGWVYGGRVTTRFARAKHGDASGVLGAARLWPAAP